MNILRSLEHGTFPSDATLNPPGRLPRLEADQFRPGEAGPLAPWLCLLPAPPLERVPVRLFLPQSALGTGQLSETIAFAALAGSAAAGVILAFA